MAWGVAVLLDQLSRDEQRVTALLQQLAGIVGPRRLLRSVAIQPRLWVSAEVVQITAGAHNSEAARAVASLSFSQPRFLVNMLGSNGWPSNLRFGRRLNDRRSRMWSQNRRSEGTVQRTISELDLTKCLGGIEVRSPATWIWSNGGGAPHRPLPL